MELIDRKALHDAGYEVYEKFCFNHVARDAMNELETLIQTAPTVDAVPISVINRAIAGCAATIQCDQAGIYTYKLRDALKTVLEWYGSPNYHEHEKRCL